MPQEPEWHPEGDVLAHTRHCLDALVGLPAWRDGDAAHAAASCRSRVLAHDFGKAVTTKQAERRGKLRWISPGHEAAGGPLAETFLQRIGAPLELIEYVAPAGGAPSRCTIDGSSRRSATPRCAGSPASSRPPPSTSCLP